MTLKLASFKFAQNSPESDIYIKQMFHLQYLRNVGDNKCSPFFDSGVRCATFGQLLPSKIDWPRTFKVARADLWVYNALLSHFLTEFRQWLKVREENQNQYYWAYLLLINRNRGQNLVA